MMKFLVIPVAIMLGCGASKPAQTTPATDTVVVVTPETEGKETDVPTVDYSSLVPTCIKKKIDSFKLKEPHERPQSVMEYTYKGKKVYYVVMPCCDFFNEVYDSNCNYLGAPDGGFTGKGDGKIPDFVAEAKNEKLIWKAPSK
jgi:hypothetical protein